MNGPEYTARELEAFVAIQRELEGLAASGLKLPMRDMQGRPWPPNTIGPRDVVAIVRRHLAPFENRALLERAALWHITLNGMPYREWAARVGWANYP